MIYLYLLILTFIFYLIKFIYEFIKINKNELSIIFKRFLYFRTNPFIRQTLILSTIKYIFRLIRKSVFKL